VPGEEGAQASLWAKEADHMRQPGEERRGHRRFDLGCPVVVTDGDGRELARTHTLNISDGGALLAAGRRLKPGQPVRVLFRLPRRTDNTYMLEEFASGAFVVRCRGSGDAPAAVRFAAPLNLDIEV
jgi:hypothetical protein